MALFYYFNFNSIINSPELNDLISISRYLNFWPTIVASITLPFKSFIRYLFSTKELSNSTLSISEAGLG